MSKIEKLVNVGHFIMDFDLTFVVLGDPNLEYIRK